MSNANHERFDVNRELQRDRAIQRIRAEVKSMDVAEDFEKVLSLLTRDLRDVGMVFSSCEIDALGEPVTQPTTAYIEANGFRYTTFRLDVAGSVTSRSYISPYRFPK